MAKNKWKSAEIEEDNFEYSNRAIEHIVNSTIKTETRGRKATGKNVGTKAYHRITISLTAQQKQQIQKIADDKGISVSNLIKTILESNGVFK